MKNELTQGMTNPYPVTRSSADSIRNPQALRMDDSVEQKENTLDPTVGKTGEEIEAEKKAREDKEKKAKYVAVSKEQQEKAKKAWEETKRRIKEMGQEVPEELLKSEQWAIRQGLEPKHFVSGASDSGPFADFNEEKYKETRLYELAQELKDLGRRGEITDERLDEIKQRLYTMAQLPGGVSDDLRHQFEEDINEAILKSQGAQGAAEKSYPMQEAAGGGKQEAGVERVGDAGFEQVRQLIDDLTNPDMEGVRAETLDTLRQLQEQILQPFDNKQEKQLKRREFADIFKSGNIEEIKEKLNSFLDQAVARRNKNIAEGKIELPQTIESIQDLARFIMRAQETELYGTKGKYPLIEMDPTTGKERFRADNFLIWVRDQIIQLHDDNRTSEMQPLSAVAIETQLRTITIYMMQRFKGQYFRDQETNEVMTDLADSAVNMCYLFGFFRNMDLAYKQVMNSDEDLPKTIVGIHAKNDVTHGDNWAVFLSMPDRFGQAVRDESGNVVREDGRIKYERDTRVGDAELVANDIYYNLSDLEELEDIAGKNGALMSKEGFKRTLLLQQIIAGKLHEWDGGPIDQPGFYDKGKDNFYTLNKETGKKDYIFNSDGSINKKNYLNFINFFNAPTPDKTQMDFVRDLIRLTIAEKAGLESGLAKDAQELAQRKARFEERARADLDDAETDYRKMVQAARINAKFAEYSSFVQQRPLMIAARNDTNRRGYDASTKLDLNYVVRQSGAGTAGPIGNTEFLKHQIIKNFGVDFVAGLKTESKRSPYEIFRDIRKVMNDTSLSYEVREDQKASLLAELRFQDSAASDYSSNAIKRSYDIFHQVVDAQSLDLNKIVSKNFLEGIKYNTAEFEKQIKDDFIKPMRYAFSSNAAMKYGQMYRGFEQLDKNGMPIYKWKTLADHMFGDEVLDDIREDAMKNKLDIKKYDEDGKEIPPSSMNPLQRYQEYLNSQASRGRIVKNITRARLAAELRKHRNRWGPAERWNADMVNKFLLALETIKAYKKDENGEIVETNERFFTDADIAWIRQHSGTGYKRMLTEEAFKDIGSGSLKGAWEGLKEMFSYVTKN